MTLALRLSIAVGLTEMGVSPWLSYAVAHAVALLFAYANHARITFRQSTTRVGLVRYAVADCTVRVTDYLFVMALTESAWVASVTQRLGVPLDEHHRFYLVAALAMFLSVVLRYWILKRFVFKQGRRGIDE